MSVNASFCAGESSRDLILQTHVSVKLDLYNDVSVNVRDLILNNFKIIIHRHIIVSVK